MDDVAQHAMAHALAFVDLRFADGHVERWLGAGSLRDDPSNPVPYAELLPWARETAAEHELIADLGMSFSNVDRQALRTTPVEIVSNGNATLPNFD